MLESILLPDEWQLCINGIDREEGAIVISISSTSPRSLCPRCQRKSRRVHSSYQRHPADLPFAGCSVGLEITVRRFFCDNNDCELTIFAERMPSLVAPYARRTNRLASQQQRVAFALGGEAGASLLTILGMATSPDTLLRLIRDAAEPEMTTPLVLGVDDWAKRKGQSYGTILVDLEAHRPVDLLPERSAESFAKWLKEHPGVKVISRDRGMEYIKGATDGAPDAIQVADRWHLLNNMKDTLKRMLESKRACLKAVAESGMTDSEGSSHCAQEGVNSIANLSDTALAEPSDKLTSPDPEDAMTPVLTSKDSIQKEQERDMEEQTDIPQQLTKVEQEKLARHERRQERYEAVHQLHQQGLSIRMIARRLKLSCTTVRKYIEAETCPMYPEGVTRGSKLTPYMNYIRQRWEEECHNASQIWRELCQLGYDGSRGLVARWAAKERVRLPSTDTQSCVPSDSSSQGSKVTPKGEVIP